ncbi:MAG TPA: D-alanyl-D-alanine carboxypeptidase/D-alanyl-D-alanine-endopeptidase [Candidatus Cybelea sp.]|jgi:D-alanyl-D-alanine carboxypeptidase/D-alanyl-D-alanine-endopeptidase (penicillin-binding protein 4)|nr:D-alanyl-D-alanine carboxypeptidase/D-alanyl-D-alanine-endopeptidase [Candidatus Cybelea sp.]
MIGAVALAAAINAPTRTPRLKNSIVAGEVYDLDAHRVLYARNAYVLMVGASTTKLLTEGTSLALLGPDFRWTTPVYRTGPIDSQGVLHGDLVLVASGDPNLSQRIQADGTLAFENEDHAYDGSADTKAVPGDPLAVLRELAAQVAKAGIKQIEGVQVDTSLFPDQGAEGGTGVIVSPIVVNDNLVDVTLTPGARPGDPVNIAVSPKTPYVTFVNRATTGAQKSDASIDMSADVRDASGHHTVTIAGSQSVGPSVLYAYRVPEPKLFAQAAFTLALNDAGIRLQQTAVPEKPPASTAHVPANLVAEHESPPLAQDAYITLKVSDNLHAGLMPYMWAVYRAHASGDYLKNGFALEAKMLRGAGLDLGQAAQQDGLGSSAFFTTDFMVHYLAWAYRQPWYPQLLRGLPILGVDGTLADIQRSSPARDKVFAKTGTDDSDNYLTGGGVYEKGLAGYTTTRSGRHVAFAFYIGAMNGAHDEDTGAVAGQILGGMAAATYLQL